jgi:cell division transport system permease protein
MENSPHKNKPNYIFTIVSVALILFLLGAFGLAMLEARRLVSTLREEVKMLVEVREGSPDSLVDALRQTIEKSVFVKEGSVAFISREEAMRLMREDFGEDLLRLDLPNPFFDIIRFNLKANYLAPDSLGWIQAGLRELPGVGEVFFQESLLETIAANIWRFGYLALALSALLLALASVLIHNTIRLALYANRFLIKSMELVGATWGFISRPYLRRSVFHALLSALLALVALALFWLAMLGSFPELRERAFSIEHAALAGALLALSVLVGALSTYYVVNKYLKMRVDDLY